MVAYTTRLPAGFPGAVNRGFEATVEPGLFLTTALPIAYGVPCILDATAHQWRGLTTGDTLPATAEFGFAVRPYPNASWAISDEALGAGGPNTYNPNANILRRGYMTVVANTGTPVKGGQVYVRLAAPSGSKVIGGVEALASDPSNQIVIPGCFFNGPADANGNVEIAFNL